MLEKFCRTVFLFFAACILIAGGRAASFTASLDSDTITLGEQARLSLKFDGVQPQNAPALPAVPGLQFQYVGPSSSFSFINGQTSSSITYNYIVAPQRDGRVHHSGDAGGCERPAACLVAAQIDRVEGQRAIRRRREFRQRGRIPEIHLPEKQNLRRRTGWSGELELYLRDDVQNFGNFQLTGAPTDGFSAGKIAEVQSQRRRVQVGNRIYTVIPLAVAAHRDPRRHADAWPVHRQRRRGAAVGKTRVAIRSFGSFSIRANKNRSRWQRTR